MRAETANREGENAQKKRVLAMRRGRTNWSRNEVREGNLNVSEAKGAWKNRSQRTKQLRG